MSKSRVIRLSLIAVMFTAIGIASFTEARSAGVPPGASRAWTAGDLLTSPTPFALGHRGYGENPGTDLTRPFENTLDAFHTAFGAGIRCVELDLQMTADKKVVVLHDDYLPDYTCIGTLTYDELLQVRPDVPTFIATLNSCRHFSRTDRLGGIIFAEIKVPIPMCDGANTSEQAAVSEAALVAAVVADIRQARMEDQVILNAGSPSILRQAALQAPEIKRALSLNALQLISPADAPAIVGMPVVKIPKNDCGLDWYNVGPIARLPSFYSGSAQASLGRFIATTLGCADSRVVSVDKQALSANPATAAAVIGAMHGAGLDVVIWTINTLNEWNFVETAGADGITTNDIPMGIAEQAPLSSLAPVMLASYGLAPAGGAPGGERVLALYPPRDNPSRDGRVTVEFSLPDGHSARIGLFDIAGRMVESRDVGSLGAGRHTFALGRDLASGLYFVRLSNGQGTTQIKATVAR